MSDISPSTIEESFPGSKDLARLGEELIGQLDRFEDDICSAWMAHHLARLMQDAKGATGEAKTEAEDRCRTAILALWRHRTELNERSEERRVGKECVSTCSTGWYAAYYKKKKKQYT